MSNIARINPIVMSFVALGDLLKADVLNELNASGKFMEISLVDSKFDDNNDEITFTRLLIRVDNIDGISVKPLSFGFNYKSISETARRNNSQDYVRAFFRGETYWACRALIEVPTMRSKDLTLVLPKHEALIQSFLSEAIKQANFGS